MEIEKRLMLRLRYRLKKIDERLKEIEKRLKETD
jgi:hypothetical protein